MGSQVSFLPCSRDLDPIKLHFPRPKIMQFHGVGRQIPRGNKTSNQVSIGYPPMEFHFQRRGIRLGGAVTVHGAPAAHPQRDRRMEQGEGGMNQLGKVSGARGGPAPGARGDQSMP